MNSLPAELKVAIADGIDDRTWRKNLSMTTRTWRNTVEHLVFDRIQWDTSQMSGEHDALTKFMERAGHRIKHVDLTIRFVDEDAPDHSRMDQLLSVFAFTPCLASLAFCARSSGRAGHAAAIEISRVTYPLFSSAIERLSQLQEVVYTEYCRLFGGRFARIVLLAGAPRIQQLILQAPMLCKKLDEVLAHRTFPAVHTLELHDRAELDVPSDVFPAVKYLTVRSEHGSSAEFPSALVQSFKQTLVALVLDSVGCPPATPLLSLPNLHTLEVNQAVPAVLTLFTRTPVVEIIVENATHVHVRILKDALRGSTGHLPFTRLAAVTFKPREGRRADRLRQAEAMDELLDLCAGRGISLTIEELPSISFASSDG